MANRSLLDFAPVVRTALSCAGGAAALVCAGCAPMPTGPTVAAMPAPNKPFEVFAQDDLICRDWAARSINASGRNAANDQMVASTVSGAAIGAVAGAIAGGDRAAGSGAAIGTMMGAGIGAEQSAGVAWNVQRSYNVAYQQCMYAKGNVIPGYFYGAYRNPTPPPPPDSPPPALPPPSR